MPQSNAPSRLLAALIKAHTKLPIQVLAVSVSRMQWATEMEITVRYGYAASIGSLVWALTKGTSDRGAFDWGW